MIPFRYWYGWDEEPALVPHPMRKNHDGSGTVFPLLFSSYEAYIFKIIYTMTGIV